MEPGALNFASCARISEDEYQKAVAGNSAPQAGDVLFSKDGTVGKVHLVTEEEPFAVLSSIAILRPNVGILESRYLAHALRTPSIVGQAESKKTGSALRRIILKDLKRVQFPLPPVEKQRRIAAILDKADAVRRKRQEAIRLTDELLRSAFLEMFGDPVTNPKGWMKGKVGDYLSFVTSGSRGWAKYYASTGARFIRSLDVKMNHISDDDAVFVNVPSGAEADRTRVQPGDVLLTITGSKIGRVAPVSEDIGEAYVSQHVAILRLDNRIRAPFLSMFMSDPRGGQRQITKAQYGQTKPGLNLQQIREFEIPIVPATQQDAFVDFQQKLGRTNQKYIEAESGSSELFESLVQRTFRGEL
jgi:type I restriction enzyme S subunit